MVKYFVCNYWYLFYVFLWKEKECKMKYIIDIKIWERKENYEFFFGFQNFIIFIILEVECLGVRICVKVVGEFFFLYYFYVVLCVVNEIKEF